MPEVPVLPEIHNNDRHPIFLDFEFSRSHDFNEYLKNNRDPCVSTSGVEVSVTIPLLAGAPNGPPLYALALNRLYEKSRGDIPKTNILYPYKPVDEIFLNDKRAFVINGSDELRISFNRSSNPCTPLTSVVKEELDKFVFSGFQFGLPAPDYSFCDRHSFESQFCAKAERIKCGVQRYAPNVCQKWGSDYAERCATTVEIENITPGFGDFILLGDGPFDILAAERYFINGSIALKYPCQE
ncbi:hypothetical protein HOLleu_04485 [Holothuria leucospilota]|uniref:Uncharacterized protein n=1 Tax=Holothuria leucospilota TaxID=206669 RepID=A0A9Q1HLW4_HOLLE|nr:hypothetical protein HOLleu_04485 [Holothuria leucospilota]